MKIRLIGIVLGVILGLLLGGGTGIVGAFGGVAGVYVFSILGAIIGFFAAPDITNFWRKLRRK